MLAAAVAWRIKNGVSLLAAFALSAFSLVVALFVALAHLAWTFDWGGTATGSSTSALMFIFLPPWSIVFGVVAAGITAGIVALGCVLRRRRGA